MRQPKKNGFTKKQESAKRFRSLLLFISSELTEIYFFIIIVVKTGNRLFSRRLLAHGHVLIGHLFFGRRVDFCKHESLHVAPVFSHMLRNHPVFWLIASWTGFILKGSIFCF